MLKQKHHTHTHRAQPNIFDLCTMYTLLLAGQKSTNHCTSFIHLCSDESAKESHISVDLGD